ncbi:ABC transporter ATP-binding protein/permease [bacterium]|nr:ABC transporter ATP-binding protein/permease [bacterium]
MKQVKRMSYYLRPYWVWALLAPIFMIVEVSMDLSQPRLLQSIVDIGIARHDVGYVLHHGLIMIIVALIGLVGGAGCTVFSTIAALNFSTDLRADLFKKVQALSFGNIDHLGTGSLITHLTNDIDQVQEAVIMFLRVLVRAPLLMVGSLALAIVTSPKLSLLLVVLSPILLLMIHVVRRKANPLFTSVQERLDSINSIVQENLAGVRVVKAFSRSGHECERFGKANENLCDMTTHASSLIAVMFPGMLMVMNLGIVGVLWFGGISVNNGSLKVGQLLAYVNYLTQMLGSLMMVSMLLMRISRADASAARIINVLDTTPEVQDTTTAKEAPKLRGSVTFDNVGFSYNGSDGNVLKDISLEAEPGETIAILGATGSGKSSLVHMIPRLYDVSAGSIRLDGMDIRELTQESLRRQIAMVLQDTILFSGTIRDNIRFGSPDATDDEVIKAAKMAQAHEFITGFADGYDSMLGQRGVNISGGQKQRLSIARALVSRPAILILDDCTSSVDMITERKIFDALNAWSHKCTRFVIAQRIRSVVDADKILVIEDGMLAAVGTHDELLRSSEVYQGIYQSQVGAVEVDSGK